MAKIQNKIELANNSNQQSHEIEKNNLPVAKYGSSKTPLKLGELEIPCYILDNKEKIRVLSESGIKSIFGIKGGGGSLLKFVRKNLIHTKNGASLLNAVENPIKFKSTYSSTTYGYNAEFLIDLAIAITESKELESCQSHLIFLANIIIKASAKTGIIALIDEALGYKEKDDAKESLSRFFNTFLLKEAAKWVKTFPDSFFFNIYKMRGWTWALTNKHPAIVGQWINDLVYKRLAPGLVDEFSKINPKNINGNRSTKNHQFIKDEYKTMLNDLFAKIDAIAKLANYDWNTFIDMLDKVAPKYPDKIND